MTERIVVEVAIEPLLASDRERLLAAMREHAAPAESFNIDTETGQIILGGASEDALDEWIGDLKRRGITLTVGAPQVAYRETILTPARGDYTHKRSYGGRKEFGRIIVELAPAEQNRIALLADAKLLPPALRDGVIQGIESVFAAGILAGFPIIGVAATIRDAAYHEADSTREVFADAARDATRKALQKAGSILLEPWMALEISGPDLLRLVTDLKARRAEIGSVTTKTIRALVPLSSMSDYGNSFLVMTDGRGTRSMQFDSYRPLPRPDDDGPFAPAAAKRA